MGTASAVTALFVLWVAGTLSFGVGAFNHLHHDKVVKFQDRVDRVKDINAMDKLGACWAQDTKLIPCIGKGCLDCRDYR